MEENKEIKIDVAKIKSVRQKLEEKFGKDNEDLQKISFFYYDVDKDKRQSMSVDEFFHKGKQ